MKPQNAWHGKGEVVEEWVDAHFFRPLGYVVAHAAAPTSLSPDHLTLICLLIGLVAGHLFYYQSPWVNAAGLVLFIISDIFDSADGQLARIRGSSTRFGRILDGMSDNLRFINLYVTVMLRIRFAGAGWDIVGLTAVAGIAHSMQSAGADFLRQVFMFLGSAKGGELELIEDAPQPDAETGWLRRLGMGLYRDYLGHQERLFPKTVSLVRQLRAGSISPELRAAYRERQSGVVRHCAWIGQNMRFLLIGATAIPGWPIGFFWLTTIPLTVILLILRMVQERNSASLVLLLPTDAPTPAHVA